MFLNINVLFGQKKLYDNILNKVEKNIDKNYYTDSIFPVRHSEYIVNGSTKDFEKVVCIEYIPTPMWTLDGKFYNQKFGFDNSVFTLRMNGNLISAKLYQKEERNNFGFTVPHRFASSFFRIDIGNFHSILPDFILKNRFKREDLKNNMNDANLLKGINIRSFDTNDNSGNQKPKISIEYENVNNKKASNSNSVSVNNPPKAITMTTTPIYTKIADSTVYIVDNVIYEGIECYKLTLINKARLIYKEFERQRFENTLINEYPDLMERQENELKQLIEYWANGEILGSQTFIVTKKNFAILLFQREWKQQNSKGEWIENEKVTEKYQEGQDKKYYQTFYTKLIRNYNGGFPNIDNYLTLVVRTPLEKVFSLNNTTIIPNKFHLAYEDFCQIVDEIDEEMLFDWDKFEK
jgi:hypothetical protein